jgi:hypothetical protein
MGHRASTKRHHLVLSPAILFTLLQLFPFSNVSLWTDLRHVCFAVPLLLFPCEFQSKASLSMALFPFLSVCPIQVHFRLFIYMDISVSPVLLQSSSFEITSGQWMYRIRRKQWLTKVLPKLNEWICLGKRSIDASSLLRFRPRSLLTHGRVFATLLSKVPCAHNWMYIMITFM